MKRYERCQILLHDFQKKQEQLTLAMEDAHTIINTNNCESYKERNRTYLSKLKWQNYDVLKQIKKMKLMLSNQGFSFGEVFSKSLQEIAKFDAWFNFMVEEEEKQNEGSK